MVELPETVKMHIQPHTTSRQSPFFLQLLSLFGFCQLAKSVLYSRILYGVLYLRIRLRIRQTPTSPLVEDPIGHSQALSSINRMVIIVYPFGKQL